MLFVWKDVPYMFQTSEMSVFVSHLSEHLSTGWWKHPPLRSIHHFPSFGKRAGAGRFSPQAAVAGHRKMMRQADRRDRRRPCHDHRILIVVMVI